MYALKKNDGIYNIFPDGINKIPVYCEMQMGGYTRLMNKLALVTNEFQKNWSQYKNGFGIFNQNYWIGLETIYKLTNKRKINMFIQIFNSTNNIFNITYSNFSVDSEANKYKLTLGPAIKGSLLDQSAYHNQMYFSTYDNVNDINNCSAKHKAGWWFNTCFQFCLTCENFIIVSGQYCSFSCYSDLTYSAYNFLKMLLIPTI